MAKVEELEARATREDGSPLGGPGPTPQRPEPELICVACPRCASPCRLHALSMALERWSGSSGGEAPARIDPARRRDYDAVDPSGWDVRCPECGAEFRVRYGLEEWGKMSSAFFPTVYGVLFARFESD